MIDGVSKIIRYIRNNLWQIRGLPYSLYFNFHYLPFKQAIKLPIMLYKPTLLKCAGSVAIESDKVRHGMICLGHNKCSIYPNTGITFENNGGKIVFKGPCLIGRDCYVSVGEKGVLSFGRRFECNAALKVACHYKIGFSDDVSLGFDCFVVDTDFHQLSYAPTIIENRMNDKPKAYGPVSIGKGCWIGTKCIVLKNTFLPAYCTVGSCSLLNKKYDVSEFTLLAGIPAVPKKVGCYRNRDDDKIRY